MGGTQGQLAQVSPCLAPTFMVNTQHQAEPRPAGKLSYGNRHRPSKHPNYGSQTGRGLVAYFGNQRRMGPVTSVTFGGTCSSVSGSNLAKISRNARDLRGGEPHQEPRVGCYPGTILPNLQPQLSPSTFRPRATIRSTPSGKGRCRAS